MPCLDCHNFRLKQAREMARQGYGLCSLGSTSQFVSMDKTCPKYRPAPAEATAARVKWLESRSLPAPSTESSSMPTEQPETVSRETTPARGPSATSKNSTGQLAFS